MTKERWREEFDELSQCPFCSGGGSIFLPGQTVRCKPCSGSGKRFEALQKFREKYKNVVV